MTPENKWRVWPVGASQISWPIFLLFESRYDTPVLLIRFGPWYTT